IAAADGPRGRDLQEAQCRQRPPACRGRQRRAYSEGGLSLPDVRTDSLVRASREGTRRRGCEVTAARPSYPRMRVSSTRRLSDTDQMVFTGSPAFAGDDE